MRVLSMGAGVQTTACLIRYSSYYDAVIFADTGNEYPETYAYIEKYLKPFCADHQIKWFTVTNGRSKSLYDDCFKKKQVPYLLSRQCTREFKIIPINRKLRELGATKKNPITVDIGISMDEIQRMNSSKYQKCYEIKNYPLITDKITRDQCKQIILDRGWPLPAKSSCYYCGFQKKSEFRRLKYTHPELYDMAMKLEKNAGISLRPSGKDLQNNGTLDGYCDSGNCFV